MATTTEPPVCHNPSCPISLFEHVEGHGECVPTPAPTTLPGAVTPSPDTWFMVRPNGSVLQGSENGWVPVHTAVLEKHLTDTVTEGEAVEQVGRRMRTGRGTCSECGGRFQLLGGGNPGTVRAHKKPGQPDRSRWCIGSNYPPREIEEYQSAPGCRVLVKLGS